MTTSAQYVPGVSARPALRSVTPNLLHQVGGDGHRVALPQEARRLYDQSVGSQHHPESVKIATLHLGESPRLHGEDPQHVMELMELDGPLPPILVHRASRRVIDGRHRVHAALMKGHKEIDAVFFDGPPESAFVVAVGANIGHGLPLSLPDRRAAAARIMRTHPQWSDRAIANSAGLSAKSVATIRRSSANDPQLKKRMGRDGRARPLDARPGRRAAADYLRAHPESSLRTVAEFAGISPATVRNVRDRLARGEDPLPAGVAQTPHLPREEALPKPPTGPTEFQSAWPLLSRLGKDPAVRMSQPGRKLLRWLQMHIIDDVDTMKVTEGVPDHCRFQLAELADRCANNWAVIAEAIRQS